MTHSEPILVSQILAAPRAEVWAAITDPQRMREWFFEEIPEFEARVGFETRFDVQPADVVYPAPVENPGSRSRTPNRLRLAL